VPQNLSSVLIEEESYLLQQRNIIETATIIKERFLLVDGSDFEPLCLAILYYHRTSRWRRNASSLSRAEGEPHAAINRTDGNVDVTVVVLRFVSSGADDLQSSAIGRTEDLGGQERGGVEVLVALRTIETSRAGGVRSHEDIRGCAEVGCSDVGMVACWAATGGQ